MHRSMNARGVSVKMLIKYINIASYFGSTLTGPLRPKMKTLTAAFSRPLQVQPERFFPLKFGTISIMRRVLLH